MALPKRAKQPGEARTLTFDFGSKLPTSDSLTGTATMSAPAGLTVGAPVRSGNLVSVRVSGGTDQRDYAVQCQCATTGGDVLQLDVLVLVREDEN